MQPRNFYGSADRPIDRRTDRPTTDRRTDLREFVPVLSPGGDEQRVLDGGH